MDRLGGLTPFSDFSEALEPSRYRALPDDWVVGLTDVTASRAAIDAGRYKAVNFAGAAAISALMNALQTRAFLFAFGGDGCAFVLPPEDADAARDVLSKTAAFVRDDLGLSLRAALVPIASLRADGWDVRAALFSPSPHVSYAMFSGGGIQAGEAAMKAGAHTLAAAGPGARPDLTGLSCRWQAIPARRGTVISLIARGERGREVEFRRVMGTVLGGLSGHPVPEAGPPIGLRSPGVGLEARASRGSRPLWRRRLAVGAHHLMGVFFFWTGVRAGNFVPRRYRALASANADVRKFGDGVMVTADCSDAELVALERALGEAEAAGVLRFGLKQQGAALMTCIVPSYQDDGHFHFVDGAGGGYAAAASLLEGVADG
ncbi:MAG: DUF3095 family protein [Pseudomonadota bacterium]